MGKCHHVIYRLTIFCLFLFQIIASSRYETCVNDARYEALALFYSGQISTPYTCDDKLGIQHGKGCRRKCNAITAFSIRLGCNPNLLFPQCIKRPSRKRREIDSECDTQSTSCSSEYEYRTIDGTCNNLRNPLWGKSDRIQNRLLLDGYDDARNSPRTMGCSGKLPSGREISNMLHRADEHVQFHPRQSYMMMQTGQFLAHDVVLTKLFQRSDGEPLQCCGEDNENPNCFPIKIPPNDPHFPAMGCMNFVRSMARQDCKGVRQQVNSQTSYIDLSMVYGANDEEARLLRSFERGLLKTVDNKLPVDMADETCELSRRQHVPEYYCTLAGDERSDEQPGLSSIHTLFVREHNRLAEGLSQVSPHWDDERLYQEARKINIAQWQNIVFAEYLPLVLGPYIMRKYELDIMPNGYKDTYRSSVDATITNSFASTSLRYGHSLIRKDISMMGFDMQQTISPQKLEDQFFDPHLYHTNGHLGVDQILLWTSAARCPLRDRKLEKSVRDKLFLDKDNNSLDLAAVNIQRARDHGIQGYTEFRRLCGLSEVTHFGTGRGGLVDHDPYVADLLAQVYSCPDDIDLYPGFLTERNSPGSILGPTAQCLVAMQFKSLRDGDRFFFERSDYRTPSVGFTPARYMYCDRIKTAFLVKKGQLREIKRIKMSTVFCLNTSIERLHRNVYMSPDIEDRFSRNRLVPCSTRRGVNLNLWRDRF